jgi:purine-nucleoside/S-methyl-5'-thioadenosine phosphorylase / adenosine deaminase
MPSVTFLTWPEFAGSGVDARVTARVGGVSSGPYQSLNMSFAVGDEPGRVVENRRRAAAAFGGDLADFVFARQVHGAGVRVVGSHDRGSGTLTQDDAIPDTDALVTTSPEVVLAILTADCVPIVLHDPVAGVLACVHSGWRGTVARVGAATVEAMKQLGAEPADIVAGIGPAIDPARYQVGPEVNAAVAGAFGNAAGSCIRSDPGKDGRWLLDLWAANRIVLNEAGLREENIHVTSIPTGGDFFSDRAVRPCGRLALLARLEQR